MEEIFYVVAFDSTHHAIFMEQTLKNSGKEVMMIPTPREISASCGLSLKIKKEDLPFIQELLKEKKPSYHGIFRVKLKQGKKVIEKID